MVEQTPENFRSRGLMPPVFPVRTADLSATIYRSWPFVGICKFCGNENPHWPGEEELRGSGQWGEVKRPVPSGT